MYDTIKLDAGYRVDLLVEDIIILELKAVDKITPTHKAQLMTYLKLSKLKLGLLLNFNVNEIEKNRLIELLCKNTQQLNLGNLSYSKIPKVC